jgi:hypothetical protein
MAGSNDFLPFASAGGANVISQSAYSGLAALGPGFSAGIAQSAQLNKVWRQSSLMASVLGQLIADSTGQNATDDGTTTTLGANLLRAILAGATQPDTGAANAYVVNFTPALTGLQDGLVVRFTPGNTNTAASTLSVNGFAHAIIDRNLQPLAGGEIASNGVATCVYSAARTAWVLVDSAGGNLTGFSAVNGSNQTSGTTLLFTAGFSSPAGAWSGSVYTAPKTGLYRVGGHLNCSNTSGGGAAIVVQLQVNGSAIATTYGDSNFASPGVISPAVPLCGCLIHLTAGDTVSLVATAPLSGGLFLAAGSSFGLQYLGSF